MFFLGFSASEAPFPQISSTPDIQSQYIAELWDEYNKLRPFRHVLPLCTQLLKMEIMRVSGVNPDHGFEDYHRMDQENPGPMASSNNFSSPSGTGLGGWSGLQQEGSGLPQGIVTLGCGVAPSSPNSYIVRKIMRMDIPVATYPNFNFVGRVLGPRGNSLKRMEAKTGCRVYIRGQGSIKDPVKEEKLKGLPGYEHLDEPLHVLIEAELPSDIIDTRLQEAGEIISGLLKPVDESQDHYKRTQLRELTMLNSARREDIPNPRSSIPLINVIGMKRAKTGP